MEDAKGQTIFLSVIGVATLLVAIVGATFAWFNISLTGDEETKNIIVTTASLSSITFESGFYKICIIKEESRRKKS